MNGALQGLRRVVARRMPAQREVARNMEVPGLPGYRRTVPGAVRAVTMVRDEADIIEHTVVHLLRQGVDGIIVVVKMSTDTTPDILRGLSDHDQRIHLGRDTLAGYHQGRKMSHLVNLARRAGADWVIPFDADEFWFAADQSLAQATDLYAVDTGGIDFSVPGGVARLGPAATTSKVALRPRRWVWIDTGNHSAIDLGRPTRDDLFIAHAPHRTLEQFERKVVQGAAALRAAEGIPDDHGHHWRNAADIGARQRELMWQQEVSSREGSVVPLPSCWRTWNDRSSGPTGW